MHSPKGATFHFKTLAVLLAVLFTLISPQAWAKGSEPVVKVMTQNMDAGTDLLFFFVEPLPAAIQDTYAEISVNDFRGRANLLADEIAAQQPYLISLQEVTLWQTIAATHKRHTLADQLELLMEALQDRHQAYEIVASQDLTDIMAPLGDGSYLRFLDRNVILARTDLKGSELSLSNVRSGIYEARIAPVPGFPAAINGWVSVDARIRGNRLRFFDTHLETAISPLDDTQVRQGEELIGVLDQSPFPVILAGDFNSDASGLGLGPDQTPTAGMIASAGYDDAWTALNAPDQGLTWPLFGEDIFIGNPQEKERIDLIFVRDFNVQEIEVTGTEEPFPSDHAGVVATLELEE